MDGIKKGEHASRILGLLEEFFDFKVRKQQPQGDEFEFLCVEVASGQSRAQRSV